jgi:hypothetical protein
MTEILCWPDDTVHMEAYWSPFKRLWVFVEVGYPGDPLGSVTVTDDWVEVQKLTADEDIEVLEKQCLVNSYDDKRCGHTCPLDKLARQVCPACFDAERQAARQRRAEKRDARPRFRLPNGSSLLSVYDADRETWSGTLEVAGAGVFEADAPTALQLLDRLGRAAHDRLSKPG